MNQDPRDVDTLFQQYAEGQVSVAELDNLNDHLRNDPQARRRFLELVNIDAGLMSLAMDYAVTAAPHQAPTVRRRALLHRWVLPLAACLMMMAAGSVFWWQSSKSAYASVSSCEGVSGLEKGRLLRDEWYDISEGAIDLLTKDKTSLVIEAPARFRFESPERVRIEHGRLAAYVPPTAGKFTVVTPSGQIVEMGTKFGVDVPRNGDAEVHVFQGEVVAHSPAGNSLRNLVDGDALSLSGKPSLLRSGAFIHPNEISSLHAAIAAGQQQVSDVALEKLRHDPSLIILLDFESLKYSDGNFGLVQGRWPGTRAAEFVKIGDHIKLNVGEGERWPRLTLSTWVRLDQLSEPYQSLLHTNDWGNQVGKIHWMITDSKKMRLGTWGNQDVTRRDGAKHEADSNPSLLFDQGRWIHLTLVYDSDLRSVKHYLNGKLDREVIVDVANPALLGEIQIGNWNAYDRKLSGRVDEMVILSRAMSDEEIKALYEAGNPYR
ncbi:LamG-like jellyroll fold domain-containing protein [Planctomicrobium sp. SH661]|uniref:LamG-like jellyroll fold domain-containing protein n=1 Tax=Planctomicrobium sp. SH661 TaxID=3448124 RepID=UPI003F5C277C